MTDNFFCLDIGENIIKVVDAKLVSEQIELQLIGSIEGENNFFSLDSEKNIENQTARIKRLIDTLKITKKNISIVIPDNVTYSQIFEMPKLNEKELISAIKYQADQFIPMPIEETNIDLEILSESEKENKLIVLIVAASKKIVEKVQKTVELAGLIPESVENELSASARFFSAVYKNEYPNINDGVIIINLSYNSTSLYYFNPKTSLILQTHTFNIGYYLFVKEIQINLNTDISKSIDILSLFNGQENMPISIKSIISPLLKEFTFELKRFINLVNEKYQTAVKNIYIINNGYRFIYIPKYLQESLSIPANFFNPYKTIKNNAVFEQNKKNVSFFIPSIGGNLR